MNQSSKKITIAIIWPGYRSYNQIFFETIGTDKRFNTKVVFIKKFRIDDAPPPSVLQLLEYQVIGAEGFRVPDYTITSLAKLIVTLYQQIRGADCVLTSTQVPVHSKVAFVIAKLLRKKIFIIVEQWRDIKRKTYLHTLYSNFGIYILKNCNKVFVHGTNQRTFLLRKGLRNREISILPFLSSDLKNTKLTKPKLKAELDLENKIVILYFGRIIPQKGLSDLLLAFSQIKDKFNDAVLLVCGGPDPNFKGFAEAECYEQKCREIASEIAHNRVVFTGPISPDQKQDYFSIADIFVHPHTDLKDLYDGWGLVINEAASMSLPMIVTDRVGASADLVLDGINGFIVPAGNPTALGSRLSDLLGDRQKLRSFSLESRRVFEQYHQPKNITGTLWTSSL